MLAFLQTNTPIVVFNQIVSEIFFCVPFGIPVFDNANSQTMRINFLSHLNLLSVLQETSISKSRSGNAQSAHPELSFIEYYSDMAHSLFDSVSSTLCSWLNSLHCWSLVCIALFDIKFAWVHTIVVFSICCC